MSSAFTIEFYYKENVLYTHTKFYLAIKKGDIENTCLVLPYIA